MRRDTNRWLVRFQRLLLKEWHSDGEEVVLWRSAWIMIQAGFDWQRAKQKLLKAFSRFKPNEVKLCLEKEPQHYAWLAVRHNAHCSWDLFFTKKRVELVTAARFGFRRCGWDQLYAELFCADRQRPASAFMQSFARKNLVFVKTYSRRLRVISYAMVITLLQDACSWDRVLTNDRADERWWCGWA